MNKKLDFAMVIHSHQPLGNFDQVMELAYKKSYLPFLKVLEEHPSIKLTLHYSGCLLDWLMAHKPEFLKILKNFAKDGQIELMGGGYYEPILSLIPDVDKITQIKMLSIFIKENFSQEARGLWLAERVWEPSFVKALAQAGILYTVVDDTHFKKVLGKDEEIYDYYISDFEGKTLFIFPGSEKLRYMLPFKLPHQSIEYLRQAKEKGASSVCFGDDGEKFGLWPKTYKWVYEEKWLDNFFTALEENNTWLNTTTLSQVIKNHKPVGRIYLPCASYREMLEWSGGYFNNFLVKYPEANWMQKRMLQVSQELDQLKIKNNILEKARKHLYMAQCNCSYWHGVFGGLYLGHLRHSVFSNLIEAEKLKEKIIEKKDFVNQKSLDIDKDSNEEIVLKNEALSVFISPYQGGTIRELDYKPKSLNLTNILSRRKEAYHQKIIKSAASKDNPVTSSPQSIHDLTLVKEEHLEDYLIYDTYSRASLLDHFLDEEVSAYDFSQGRYKEERDFINKAFEPKIKRSSNKIALNLSKYGLLRNKKVLLIKEIKIFKNKAQLQIDYSINNQDHEPITAYLGTEFNFYLYNGKFITPGKLEQLNSWDFQDEWYKVKVNYKFSQPASLIYYPIETVSDSEGGMERSYQGLSQVFFWPINLNQGGTTELKIILNIES